MAEQLSADEDSERADRLSFHAQHSDASLAAGEDDGNDDTPSPRPGRRRWAAPWTITTTPFSAGRVVRKAWQWTQGPASPRPYTMEPLWPAVQRAPLWVLDRYLTKKQHRMWLALAYLAVWVGTFALVLRAGRAVAEMEGWGTPISIACGNTYWVAGNGCGLDGDGCRPFDGSGFAFRCPASCAGYQVLNYRAVGAQEVIYQPLVVGGPPAGPGDADDADASGDAIYRGDSFICGAAVHAGIVTNSEGGCGVVRLVGTRANFTASTHHAISSLAFDSYFPLSFTFDRGHACSSRDMRWPVLAVSVTFSTVLSLFTSSPAYFFFSVFAMVFWTVGLATDPPGITSLPGLFSDEVGKFLPAMFAAWLMYDKMGVRRVLTGLTAQVEKTVLWLGACWIGALTNYTLDFIPIQRLTGHDLEQQPGAKAALALIVSLLLVIASTQVLYLREEGRLRSQLKLYALFVAAIILCLVLPDLRLRIHHYILALLLLPGTSIQTRPSLLYQGILVGLFINGIARWGWDPFLQTAAALQGDAQVGSALPSILAPTIAVGTGLANITFTWQPSPGPEYDGISILVNDVERFRSYFDDTSDNPSSFSWTRTVGVYEKEYFRFGWMSGSASLDYTKAGIWTSDHEWTDMAPGPSRVKTRGGGGDLGVELR
ncbi:hypothetical protein P8C59_007957 [Phyllachora maydis]|uniref:LCCL domain-containing protein n=1 Tax=Phyllachora maydis TaxID=1825666 RepID=A0AAD9I9H7_9PEZI|nr:hypothetical protein P8C59_007957 [Phyllachora maydis]